MSKKPPKPPRVPAQGESIPIEEASNPWECPVHKTRVSVIKRKKRTLTDEDSAYIGCLLYRECGYYVTTDFKKVARSKFIEGA